MGFLLPKGPKIRTEGPKLDSLQVTDSAYGKDIPIPFGTVRLGGNVIWSTDLREEKVEETVRTGGKGGGGRGSQTTVTYLYYVSFAVCFGEGVARDVLRIWADGKLLFDQKEGTSQGTKAGINYRFYPGDETQLPDSLIVADKGPNSPAHRGLCYIVFDEMPLQDFGNRIPSITAEINFESRQTEVISTETVGVGPVGVNGNGITADWARDRVYLRATDASEISVFSLSTLQKVQSLPFYEIRGVVRSTGEIIATQTTAPVTDVLLNPFSGSVTRSTTRVPFGGGPAPADEFFSAGVGVSLATPVGTFKAAITRPVISGIQRISFHDLDDLSYIGGISAPDNTYNLVTLTDTEAPIGLAFGGFWNPSQILIYAFQLGVDVGLLGDLSVEVNPTLVRTIVPSDVHPDATSFSLSGGAACYSALDEASRSLLFGIGTNVGTFLVKLTSDGTIDWAVQVPFVRINSTAEADTRVSGGAWAYHNGSAIVRVNVATGSLDPELNGTRTVSGLGYDGVFFDDERNAIYNFSTASNATEFRRHTLGGRAGKNVRVKDIIDRLSERVGVQPVTDSDVTQLTDSVEGFIVDSRMSVKKALEPLAMLYFFDVVERDGKLVYQMRGNSTGLEISEDDFVRVRKSRSEQYVETREQEAELPAVFNVNYLDPGNDYQSNTAGVRRILAPDKSVRSDNSDEVDIPAVISATTAKRTAERLLYTKWLERTSYELSLPQKWLYLDPTDVATITLNNGFSFRGRFDEFDIGKDFSAKTQVMRENAGQYVSDVEGDGGSVPGQIIPTITPTQPFFLDIPLLRDVDSLAGTAHRGYFAGNNYGQGNWPGTVVAKSPDGTTWDTLLQQMVGIAWGITTTTLGEPASYWRTDEENSFDVIMVDGSDLLESVTDLELVNQANGALLIKPNGEVGIIQFRDVTALGNNQFRFSGLLRGRRGSEQMDRDYSGNEIFLFLGNPAALAGFSLTLDERGQSRLYKPVTIGQLFEAAVNTTFTHTGRDLKPYAPVSPAAEASGSDIELSWIRRTRLGGESDLADGGTGIVPIAEASEAYDIEILNGSGAVVRTITDHPSNVLTYTAAQMNADGIVQIVSLPLLNPGFEENLLNWINEGPGTARELSAIVATPSPPAPRTGTKAWGGWTGTANSSAYQDVVVPATEFAEIDAGTSTIKFAGYQNSYAAGNDFGQLEVQCLDGSDTVLATFTTTSIAPTVWTRVEAEGLVPTGTRKFRARLRGTYALGSQTDAYFEDLTLDLFTTQPPTSISFNVYQKSAVVGRGFKGEFTDVEIA